MKLTFWVWVALVLLAGGLAFYLLWRSFKRKRRVSSKYGIPAGHVPFEFDQTIDREECPFRVDWPPKDPADARRLRTPPLLNGQLVASAGSGTASLV